MLALSLAATAADSPPPPPKPAGFISAISVLQAAKDALFPSSGKKNVAKKPSAVRSNVLKQNGKNLEEDEPSPRPCIEELSNQISETITSGNAEEIDLFPYWGAYRIGDTDKLTIHIACDKNILRLCVPANKYELSKNNSHLSIGITDVHQNIMSNINSKGFKIISIEKLKLDKNYQTNFKSHFSLHLSDKILPVYEVYFYDICPGDIFSVREKINYGTFYAVYIPQRAGIYILQYSKDTFKKFFGKFNDMATPVIDL